MTILQERGSDCQQTGKDEALSVLTNARALAQIYLEDSKDVEHTDVFLAAIFIRLDDLVRIVEKIKIPRMLL